ncbi:MAG: endolytic transglycosylase MltG [Chlorobi bacterium]|nr:endolytic transglycosylase MltG [Chlorobiota bacterium]
MTYYHSRYNSSKRKKKSKLVRGFQIFIVLLLIAAGIIGYKLYTTIYQPNTWVKDEKSVSLYIPTGAGFEDLKTMLYEKGIVINRISFEWLAKKKNLKENVHPGRYLVYSGMSNDELINLLRSGNQTPVKLVFNNIRTKGQLAKVISSQIEPDSAEIILLLNDSSYTEIFEKTPETILSLFIPNTYEVYWNISSTDFMDKMFMEYNKFWNDERKQKARELEMTPLEVSILASIVEQETRKDDEKERMAGVYINRLKYGWRLQADPTIVYAWGDFSIRRVLNIHKKIDSPYNTYLHEGLPPGPICIPSIASIDAVLNYEHHSYLFFCAKDDFSGYHAFAKTHDQHIVNANKYRRALDARNIKK